MQLTDTHTHLYSREFDADRAELIRAAGVQGIDRFFLPNIDGNSVDAMLALEKDFPGKCFAMMGLHPCSVGAGWKEEMRKVEEWLAQRKFVAIGEMGIDLFWDKTFVEEQKDAFRRQVELANHYRLPIVIHTRNSFSVAVELLKEVKKEQPCGIFHCFTGSAAEAANVIDMGFYLGIGGVVTFKNSGLDSTLKDIPLENIVLETDAPYLAPVPFRGKRNEPAYLMHVAEKISVIKNCPLADVGRITTENSKKIFGC